MDRDGIRGFVEERAMIADAEPEQAFKLSAERLDASSAGFGIAVDGTQYGNGGALVNGADLDGHVRLKADSLHRYLAALGAADLIHGEAALGDDLLEGEAFASLAEVLT